MARTTRVNISVPVTLQERLKHVKEQINVSKICVAALERELELLEARPAVTVAPEQLERLIRRLQNNRERWAERGRQDGERWAIEVATRDELHAVGERGELASTGDGVAAGHSRSQAGGQTGGQAGGQAREEVLPRSFDLATALDTWIRRDAGIKDDDLRYLESGRRPRYPSGVEEALQRARAQLDEAAYREGWTKAARTIWMVVRPVLQ